MLNKKKKQGFFTKILCTLLSIVLFIMLTVAIMLTLFRDVLSDSLIESLVDSISLSGISFGTPEDERGGELFVAGTSLRVECLSRIETPPTDVIATLQNAELQIILDAIESENAEDAIGDILSGEGVVSEKTLLDFAYDMCKRLGYESVDREKLGEVIDGPLVKNFITETIEDYREYIMDGNENSTGLTAEKIVSYVKENEEEIKAAVSYIGIDEDIEIDYDELEREVEKIVGDELSIDNLVMIDPDSIKAVRSAVSREMLLVLWGIVGAISLVIVLLCINTISNALVFIGVPTGLLGGLMVLVATRVKPLVSSYQDNAFYDASAIAFPTVFKLGIILTAIGVLMLVAKIVIMIAKRNKA